MNKLKPSSEMERITLDYLQKNTDEVFETVITKNVGIVITQNGKDNLVICPAEWIDGLE